MPWLTIIWKAWIWISAIQEFYLQLLLWWFSPNLWFGDVPAMALSESRIHVCWIPHVLLYIIVGLSFLPCIQCVDGNDYSQTGNPAVLPIVTQLIYGRLSNLTKILSQDIKDNLGFCIKDVWVIWWSFYSSLMLLSYTFGSDFLLSGMLIGMVHSILLGSWISWQIVSRRQRVRVFGLFQNEFTSFAEMLHPWANEA